MTYPQNPLSEAALSPERIEAGMPFRVMRQDGDTGSFVVERSGVFLEGAAYGEVEGWRDIAVQLHGDDAEQTARLHPYTMGITRSPQGEWEPGVITVEGNA